MALVFIFKSLIFCQLLLLVSAHYGKCPPSFDCGFLGEIKFPFTTTQRPDCGILAIRGCDDPNPEAPKTIQLSNKPPRWFRVSNMESHTIIIRDDYQDNLLRSKSCKAFSSNFTVIPPSTPLASFQNKYNITLFRCNHSLNVTLPKPYYNYRKCQEYSIYYGLPNTEVPPGGFKWPSFLASCSTIQLAVRIQPTGDPFEFLSSDIGIEVRLSDDCDKCLRYQKGQCQLDIEGKFFCAKGSRNWVVKMVVGLGLGNNVHCSSFSVACLHI